jgi:diacylglycerol O-acyltransferase / wax synthase
VAQDRLSPLDASFLAVESPSAHMHVGWVAYFDPPAGGPRPSFEALAAHVATRLERAPRWHQRLAPVPLGLHEPVWEDDPGFDPAGHLHLGEGGRLEPIAEAALSVPLARDRPLWDMWFVPELDDGRVGVVGKAHHCMVDGVAALELAAVLLDRSPDGGTDTPAALEGAGDRLGAPPDGGAGRAVAGAGATARLARALGERAWEGTALATLPVKLALRPGAALRMGGAVARAALPMARASPVTGATTPARTLVTATRPVDDLRAIRRRWGTAINDAVLAAAAGALRSFALRRGTEPVALKAMIPVDVRSGGDGPGNRITFVYLTLPCDEPDPVLRLMHVHRATTRHKLRGDAEGTDAALQALALAPRTIRRAAAHMVASPRMYNLVVSSLPGPRLPVYMAGCRLRAIHPAVPLAAGHALSIGVCTVGGDACFGFYADRVALPDAAELAGDLDAAVDELIAAG